MAADCWTVRRSVQFGYGEYVEIMQRQKSTIKRNVVSTTIELQDDEGALFLKFREHQDKIEVLEAHGFFEMSNGSIVFHFDNDGNIRQVEMIRAFRINT